MIGKKQKILIIASAALAILAGAAFAYFKTIGNNVPNEKKMARIVADMYIADALLQDYVVRGAKDLTVKQVYNTILQNHGLTMALYDSALAYYSLRPEDLSAIYERAVSIVSEREAAVKEIADRQDSIEHAIELANDSITTYLGKCPAILALPLSDKADSLKRYLFPKGKKYQRIAIDFDVDSISGGYVAFSQRYSISRVAKDSKGRDLTSDTCRAILQLTLADGSTLSDTAIIENRRRVQQRDVELKVEIPDSATLVKVKLLPFECKVLHDMTVNIKDIKVFHKPYDIIDTTAHDFELPLLFTNMVPAHSGGL